MLVDWVTAGAQLVNFLVLVALLRYFLYGRIIRTVDEREEEIRSRLEEAEEKAKEAARKLEEQQQRERDWAGEGEERLARAKKEAEERKSELVEQARGEVDELRERWREALERDETAFLRDLREGVGSRAFAIAREAVAEFADEELERHVLRVFRERISELSSERKKELRQAIEASDEGPRLVSAFEIGEEEREALSRDLGESLGRELELDFETSPGVICGVELVTDGRKVGFSLGSRLDRLEEWAEEQFASELGERREKAKEEKGAPEPSEEAIEEREGSPG